MRRVADVQFELAGPVAGGGTRGAAVVEVVQEIFGCDRVTG